MSDVQKPLVRLNKLLQKLWDNLSDAPDANRDAYIRAIPLIFPIVETTWRIRQRVTTPIGLIERHVLKAVEHFGPCSPETVDALMGLGLPRVEQVLQDMVAMGAPLTERKGVYSILATGNIASDHFVREIEQDAVFLRNGITNSLLPIRFLDQHKDVRTELRPGTVGRDRDGELASIAPVLQPIATGLVIQPPPQGAQDLGFPEGFIGLAGEMPIQESATWIVAFALLDNQGGWTIWSSGSPPLCLVQPRDNLSGYLGYAAGNKNVDSQCKSWRKEWNSPELSERERDHAFPSLPGLTVGETTPGQFEIKLHKPETVLAWNVLQKTACQGEERKKAELGWNLLRGWDWAPPPYYTLTRLEAGDQPTKRQLLLLQGSYALKRKSCELNNCDSVNTWWNDWQRQKCQKIAAPFLPLPELIKVAREYNDSEFREWVDELFLPIAHKMPAACPSPVESTAFPAVFTQNQPGRPDHGDAILDLLRNATSTIDIITPVIDDERVMAALADATERRVRVRVITALQKRSGFRTAGFEPSLDPANDVAILHSLAKMKVYLRCPRWHPHAKLIIVDNRIIVISSANLNDNSLGGGNRPALEAGLVIADTRLVAAGVKLFNAVWQGSPYRYVFRGDVAGQGGGTFDISEEGKSDIPAAINRQDFGRASLGLFLPLPNMALQQPLTDWLDKARHTVVLASMSLYGTDQVPPFHRAMLEALKRKVDVTIYLRPANEMNFSSTDWPDAPTRELLQHGLRICEVPALHAKGILVDENLCGIFSGNINPYSLSSESETGHLETGLFGDVTHPWLMDYAKFLQGLCKSALKADK